MISLEDIVKMYGMNDYFDINTGRIYKLSLVIDVGDDKYYKVPVISHTGVLIGFASMSKENTNVGTIGTSINMEQQFMLKVNKNTKCVIGKEFCAGCDLFDGHECTRENTDCKKCLTCANFGVNPCGWGGVIYVCKQTTDN